MRIQPKNWQDFQHYKDRSPIWIKLHRKLLDDYEFHCLPTASRAVAPLLWLLSSEYDQGIIDASEEKISFRMRLTAEEFRSALEPLISSGFFVMYQVASMLLAEPEQVASLEKRREEIEKEEEKEKTLAASRKPDSPPKIGFDYATGKFLNVTQDHIALWKTAYPAVDLIRSVSGAAAWAKANPANRKKNWERFITMWLSRDQEKSGRVVPSGAGPARAEQTRQAARDFVEGS